ncbi:MAG: hypothetical protein CVT64_06020 [Actinobacteria bacterium HGW-Actinobacteria-4]|nr:MAG: hypothetical protein CVT64_06020 [Actinobacteria bacterium HGW-Actinobacteria-4]
MIMAGALVLAACSAEEAESFEAIADIDVAEIIEDEVQAEAPAVDPGGEVDVCALLGAERVAALLADELREPRASGAAGNMLGSCSWTADNNGRTLSAWAWPIDQWDAAIATDDFGTGPIDGLGARAESTNDGGLLVDPGGEHYYFQIFVIDTDGSINFDLARQGAELLLNP